MMAKTKINILQSNTVRTQAVDNLTSEGRRAFMYLLSTEGIEEDGIFFEEDNARQEFDEFLDDYENGECFFVGFRGTGKSAFLYNYFQLKLGVNYWIDDDTLFFYLGKNSIIEYRDVEDALIEELIDLYRYLQRYYGMPDDEDLCYELYNFIVNTKKSVLENPYLDRKKDSADSFRRELLILEKEKKMTSILMYLKFCLLDYVKDVKRLILIFDYVEDRDAYSSIFKKMYDCMLRYDKKLYTSGYHVKAIYTIRPMDFRAVANGNGRGSFEIIQKDAKTDIQKLFDKRFKFAMGQEDKWWEDKRFGKEDLKFAYEKLEDLNTKYNQKYKKMIQGLSFYDVYKALECYKSIIFNQTWIQKERFQYGDDEAACVLNSGFLFNNITCIRALACKNDQIYRGNTVGCVIPNILYNTEDEEDYSIYILLLMKYFVRRNSVNDFFGEESGQEFSEVLKTCEDIFGRGKEYNNFRDAIVYMHKCQILRKSIFVSGKEKKSNKIYEREDQKENRNTDDLVPESRLYISTRGAELWDMLRGDSVLMEICREDYFREQNEKYNFESSYKLISIKKQKDIFEDLLLMIEDFKIQEDKIFECAKQRGKVEELEKLFGKRRMTYFLLEGVNKSILYSSSCANEALREHESRVEQLVNEKI